MVGLGPSGIQRRRPLANGSLPLELVCWRLGLARCVETGPTQTDARFGGAALSVRGIRECKHFRRLLPKVRQRPGTFLRILPRVSSRSSKLVLSRSPCSRRESCLPPVSTVHANHSLAPCLDPLRTRLPDIGGTWVLSINLRRLIDRPTNRGKPFTRRHLYHETRNTYHVEQYAKRPELPRRK